ncbi:MAG: polysaccharide biosynthesis/export family protein [Kiritimatiellia bacterium]
MIRRAAASFLVAALLAGPAPLRAAEPGAALPLRKGDALLVRIEGLGGGLPEYREIVDSDGQIELPFLGMVAAAGKSPAAVAGEMAAAYAEARLATQAIVRIELVTHFEPPPARATLNRAEDPRRPVPAAAPVPVPPPAP